ncbi:sensor histidine kinase [Paenibacillus sp. GCM10023248]|uniref:cache domain-containing sensor histidine kinase n=1 Tax=Bacillales TaxID=1385 RepID=UPI002379F660|nr:MULTISPECIES: sensor histidine kinase [Bacillales]MDD9269724.1 histidine kinase [Paenibacillus sp. MAHUQ-63]MDR6881864.1 two-component system sensor histidine kinase YesM [Bacillus sp. 3255]
MRRGLKFIQNSSITARMFTLFFGLSILVVVLMASFSFYFYNKAVKHDFKTITGEASERLSYHLEFYLKQMAQSTGTMITNSLTQDWLEGERPLTSQDVNDLHRALEMYISFNFREIVNLYLVSSDKRVFALNPLKNNDYSHEPWFQQTPTGKSATMPTYRTDNGQPVMSMLIPVYSTQDVKLIGNLVIEFSLAEVKSTFMKSNLGSNGFFFMLSDKGEVVYYPQESWLGQPLQETDLAVLDLRDTGRSSVQWWNGRKSLVDVIKSEQTGWYIVAIVPYQEIASGLNSAINSSIITVIIIIICLVGIIPLVLRKFIEPVKKMKSAMERVSRGDLSIRVDQISDINEFQSLSHSFNKMVDQLNENIQMVAELEVKEVKLQLHQQEATIQALQNQINPHLLYNTLGIISGIASIEDSPLIGTISQNLADIYRYAASFSNMEVTLSDELSILRKYLDIIHVRFPRRFDSKVVIHEKYLNCRILKLTLQPIVENAVKYGVEARGGGGAIIVTAFAEGQDLIIEIADNGPGIDEAKQRSYHQEFQVSLADDTIHGRESLGLPNVHNRIRLKYGAGYGIAIHSFPGRGTVTSVRIPLLSIENASER